MHGGVIRDVRLGLHEASHEPGSVIAFVDEETSHEVACDGDRVAIEEAGGEGIQWGVVKKQHFPL
jgi:hypothetical protein